MKNEIRKAVALPEELEDETFELQGDAMALLDEGKTDEAVEKILSAWEKLPEPRFNTSCSHTILIDLIEIFNAAGKYEESKRFLKEWIEDLESSGYKIWETTPYILLAETLLFLGQPDDAKEAFYQAMKYGATKRDMDDKPSFYFEIAKKKMIGNEEIMERFTNEVLNRNRQSSRIIEELSDEVSDRIEELSEKGNVLYEENNLQEAVDVWKKALELIPAPQNSYAESLWLESSIGDVYYLSGKINEALQHFLNAKGNLEENAYENPFIMLRLGQLYLDLEAIEEAKEYLIRAYMLEGEELFEEEDKKYLNFLKQHVKL
jgi:tetratricopeptide (TPR) repeat protein